MKTLSLLAATLSLSIFSLAHAETYDGVHAANSVKSRAEVAAEAERTAASPNQNVARGSRGAEPFTSTANRDAVYADAVKQANAPDQNVSSGSKVNSRVISTMTRTSAPVQAQQQRPAVAN
ncbi:MULTISPECIES: DUF4148 domain-containing protein [unclassified Variovorax]|uniref:DUF4148 domain-containing protein n=1 Tax=unclassified Variovorax TaxID=663243 RepID=UPI001601CB57|nr:MULTISPECIES: DUF4148 domain-containing protein [unclassified Variovorax]MBB1598496.1 hypothetical protein [Variovorax sp. UMC13]MDM0088959.1 DUF4148 domain-containing protein [Variovorax sp. J22G40]MDM0147032.1 DUF4148 domain-containing protein [Variovorax sp. J2P1-31]